MKILNAIFGFLRRQIWERAVRISRIRFVRWTAVTLACLILLLGAHLWSVRDPILRAQGRAASPGPQGEVIQPDEDVAIAKLVAASTALATQEHDLHLQADGDNTWRRDVHGKTPGCIRASFTVSNTPDRLKYGLFAAPGKYDAVIRFSDGNHQLKPDTEADVRGMALKVFGVPGRKLLEGEEDALTQDFLMMDSPVYFFSDVATYAQFSQMLTWGPKSQRFKWVPKWLGGDYLAPSGTMGRDLCPFFRYSWNPFDWNIKSVSAAGKAQKKPPPSPLHVQYFSASACRLGPQQFVKYSMLPCDANYMRNAPKLPSTENGLHEALKQALAPKEGAKGWCFDFMVQPQVVGKNMPVEDPSSLWSEEDSPFVTVAKIEIPPQTVPDQQCFCDNLAFNPWHSLPEHKPAGVFNRIRKAVYQEDARFRRTHQGTPLSEPATLEEATSASCPAPRPAAAVTKAGSMP